MNQHFFTASQGTLADYNLLVDKLNTDTERAEVESEAAELRAQNEAESREVEALFAEKQVSNRHVANGARSCQMKLA